ncbi:MAG: type IX secretion system membrane protein PorP/SprF [Bacteroidota bacterium]
MKKIILFLSLFCLSLLGFAQQDAQVTHNMFNKLAVNPGYAGSSNGICGNLLTRTQWVGLGGGPQTGILSVDGIVKKAHGGAGLTIVNDQIGQSVIDNKPSFVEKTFYIKGAYAYRQAVGPGILGVGLDLGFLQKSLEANWLTPTGGDGSEDGSIPDARVSSGSVDIGLGAYYQIPGKAYLGISSIHLQTSKLFDEKTNDSLVYKLVRNYYIMGGYEQEITEMLTVKPSVLVKTDFASTQIEVAGLVYYNNTYWAGLNYRTVDALSLMLGYQAKINDKMNYRIGYSYDLTTSQLRTKSSGSHELLLGFCYIPQSKFKVTKYKNVRFL